jgi:AAA ATPase domain
MSALGGAGSERPAGALLERAGEVSAIAAACQAAQAGDGRVVVLAGRAGIGKSSLLLEGQRAARAAGFTVLTARPSGLEREFAFGVVRQLLERAVQRAPHWWAGAAEQAHAVFGDVPAATSGVFEDVSQSVLHGLYWLVVNASVDGPVLLSVDDLQLCDRLRCASCLTSVGGSMDCRWSSSPGCGPQVSQRVMQLLPS